MRGQRETGRRRAARPRHGDGQAGDQIGLGVDRELHVGQVPRQIGDDVDVPLRPKMIDEAKARRNELRVGVRRAEVGVERAGLVVELVAPELRLAVENGGAVRAIGVEARQPPAGLGSLVIEAELLVGLQQQLQGRQTAGILIDDQLQVVAGAVPLARLGVDRAEPVAKIAEIGGRAGRQETQQLLEPQRRGGGVAARERQLGEHAARLDVARAQDCQLAVERLCLGGVAEPLRQRRAPLHDLLAWNHLGDVRDQLERRVELARAVPVLLAVADLRQQHQRPRVLRGGGQRQLQIVGGGRDLAARERDPRLRHQGVGAQHGLRLDPGRPPVLLLGGLVAGGGGWNGHWDVRRRVGGQRHGRHGARERLRPSRRPGRVRLGRRRGSGRLGSGTPGRPRCRGRSSAAVHRSGGRGEGARAAWRRARRGARGSSSAPAGRAPPPRPCARAPRPGGRSFRHRR